jgi:uncharacterized protein (UPF0276 family)
VDAAHRALGNRFGLPNLGIGVGLRSAHYRHILAERPAVDWFEIITDNYLETGGRPLRVVEEIARHYPIAMHGVSLSIGSADPLDLAYVERVRALRDRLQARWVSDHLCWTGINGRNSHDLLPLPYSEEALVHVSARVHEVQERLGAPLLIENPSTYVAFAASTMTEWEFLAELCRRTSCGLLLDVNNIFVSARNHGFDPLDYLAAVPWDQVAQFHVAGHTDHGTHCVDTHVGPVPDPVWQLLARARARANAAVLLEWDTDIPDFATVHAEALRAGSETTAAGARP